MNQILLSIIVPVFRVEQYIDKCVQSLVRQGMNEHEYEIILVDDGSDDNCPAMCDQYAKDFSQIKAIHQPNKGLSGARNTGIRAAKGLYVCFVDSDDYVEENTYKPLVHKAIEHNLDILKFGFTTIYKDKIIGKSKITDDINVIYTGQQLLNPVTTFQCFSWLYIVKKQLICDTDTFFTEGIKYEDMDWTPRIMLRAERMMLSEMYVYNYVLRDGSISRPKNKEGWRNAVNDYIIVLKLIQQTSTTVEDPQWFEATMAMMNTAIMTLVAKHLYEERTKYLHMFRETFPYALAWHHGIPLAENIKIICLKYMPNLFCLLRHYL